MLCAVADRLDRVRDHLARDERVLHALGAHRDAVADGDGAEDLRHGAGGAQRGLGARGQAAEAGVAGRDVAVGVGDAHDRLPEVAVAEADRAQHRAVGGALHALGDEAAPLVLGHGPALPALAEALMITGPDGYDARAMKRSARLLTFALSSILHRALPPVRPSPHPPRSSPTTPPRTGACARWASRTAGRPPWWISCSTTARARTSRRTSWCRRERGPSRACSGCTGSASRRRPTGRNT